VDDAQWEQRLEHKRAEESQDLRYHWGTAYAITWHGSTFIAARNDTGEILSAGTADELRDKIRADYIARPVPRQPSG
jgi:hypothetical protein